MQIFTNEHLDSLVPSINDFIATRGSPSCALHDATAGYLKKSLSSTERESLAELILEYHDEKTPLLSPVTLLGHFIDKYDISYLKNQYF